jgi:hypothetical protein
MAQLFSRTKVSLLLAAIILVVVPGANHAQSVKPSPVPKNAAPAAKKPDPLLQSAMASFKANRAAFLNVEANTVRTAKAFVTSAQVNYGSRKTNAANYLQSALSLLDGEAAANGTPQQRAALQTVNKVVTAQAVNTAKFLNLIYQDPQASSDAQMRAAAVLLLQLEPVLSANQQVGVLTQVDKAGQEIVAALNTTNAQVKFNQAEVLREAKILLVTANRDYDGHRIRAVNHVQQAITHLDKNIMKNGTTLIKLATLAEDDATVRASVLAKYLPRVHENQIQSDVQLMAAAGLLLQVELSMSLYNQRNVMESIELAGRSIMIALRVQ